MNVSDGCILIPDLVRCTCRSRRGRSEDAAQRVGDAIARQRDLPFRGRECGFLILFRRHFETLEIRWKHDSRHERKTFRMPRLVLPEFHVPGELLVGMLFHYFCAQLSDVVLDALAFFQRNAASKDAVPETVEVLPLGWRRAFRCEEKQVAALIALRLRLRYS